ncbi:hypothetical protein ACWDBD_50265 [Streptomyces sp. NPDC001118]|uniref:hypothetical protein n=1 Tax=unclassified Streptomyces TaxID=2593676 RepID=UPI00331C4DF3
MAEPTTEDRHTPGDSVLKSMKNTARQPFANTLTDLGRAMDERRAVVIAYADADTAAAHAYVQCREESVAGSADTGSDDGRSYISLRAFP